MLSGIGDANHLISHDVKPIIDLPGVGQNLADHLDVSIQYGSDRMDLSAARYQRIDQAALLLGRWLMNGTEVDLEVVLYFQACFFIHLMTQITQNYKFL